MSSSSKAYLCYHLLLPAVIFILASFDGISATGQSTKGKGLELLKEAVVELPSSANGSARLRVLILLIVSPYMMTHFNLDREMARLLNSDEHNVEYVHLLALAEGPFAQEMKKEGMEVHSPRMVVEFESLPQGEIFQLPNPWEERMYFYPKEIDPDYLAVLQNHSLISRLHNLHFNVGLTETFTAASLAIFQMLPSIQKTAATLPIFPIINFYELLGFQESKIWVPDMNYAEFGDHQLVGKSENELRQVANAEASSSRVTASRAHRVDLMTGEQLFRQMKERQQQIRETNQWLLEQKEKQEKATWTLYCPYIHRYIESYQPHLLPSSCPSLSQLFQGISYFFSNTQPNLGFPVQQKWLMKDGAERGMMKKGEEKDEKHKDNINIREKLQFIGGIALPDGSTTALATVPSPDKETDGILNQSAATIAEIGRRSPKVCQHLPTYRGTILVTFGTAVKMADMPAEKRAAFRDTFHQFGAQGYQFIWKNRDRADEHDQQGAGFTCDGNIFLNSWVKQPQILKHPRTVLFISHCGNNSLIETVHARVPWICFPFFGDQNFNAEAMASRGLAIALDIREKHVEKFKGSLTQAIHTMLQTKYKPMAVKSKSEAAADFLKAMANLRTRIFAPRSIASDAVVALAECHKLFEYGRAPGPAMIMEHGQEQMHNFMRPFFAIEEFIGQCLEERKQADDGKYIRRDIQLLLELQKEVFHASGFTEWRNYVRARLEHFYATLAEGTVYDIGAEKRITMNLEYWRPMLIPYGQAVEMAYMRFSKILLNQMLLQLQSRRLPPPAAAGLKSLEWLSHRLGQDVANKELFLNHKTLMKRLNFNRGLFPEYSLNDYLNIYNGMMKMLAQTEITNFSRQRVGPTAPENLLSLLTLPRPKRVFWLLRHSERYDDLEAERKTEGTHEVNGRLYGWDNAPLSVAGKQRARKIQETFRHIPFRHVFACPFARNVETVHEVLGQNHVGLEVKLDPGFFHRCREPSVERCEDMRINHPRLDCDYTPVDVARDCQKEYGFQDVSDGIMPRIGEVMKKIFDQSEDHLLSAQLRRHPYNQRTLVAVLKHGSVHSPLLAPGEEESEHILIATHGTVAIAMEKLFDGKYSGIPELSITKFVELDTESEDFTARVKLIYSADMGHLYDKKTADPDQLENLFNFSRK